MQKISEIKKQNPARYWLGKHRSEEFRKKISESLKKQYKEGTRKPPMLNKKHSEEAKKKIGLKGKGRKHTEEWKRNMSRIAKLKGLKPPIYYGEQHPNWKGGQKILYGEEWTDTLRKSIRQRDNYKCRRCGVPQEECLYTLCVHHFDENKDNLNPKNLISLCRSCHMIIHHKIRRFQYKSNTP